MKSRLTPANHDHTKAKRIAFVLLLAFFLISVGWPQVVCGGRTPQAERVLAYLKGLGNGRYMFEGRTSLGQYGQTYCYH